jgi:hypothetical protein
MRLRWRVRRLGERDANVGDLPVMTWVVASVGVSSGQIPG